MASVQRSDTNEPVSTILPRQRSQKKSHKKSRNGCLTCKRRKVKCDEIQPRCSKCIHFRLQCRYENQQQSTAPFEALAATVLPQAEDERVPKSIAPARRRRGRPRKDWTAQDPTLELHGSSEPGESCLSRDVDLNMTQAELLHQFITCTGPNLGSSDDPNHPIVKFWARNATLLALSHPYLLRLCLSLAAYHLAFLPSESESDKRARHIAVAQHHFSVGLAQTNDALANIDASTCGSLYVSTILVCFCSFAAGPRGPDDLFVCSVGSKSSPKWLPLARGTRLIRQLYEEEVLFSGPTEPLGIHSAQFDDPRPTCVCQGFVRIDWINPIERLRALIASSATPCNDVYVSSLNTLSAIYEGTFGDDEGRVECPLFYKLPLVWIYMMEDPFVECLQKKDAIGLLLLAYYAPLIKTMKGEWFLHGWAEHIIGVSRKYITDDFADFLQWPAQAVEAI